MEELKPKRMIFDANGEWVCWDEVKKNFESLTKENKELKARDKTYSIWNSVLEIEKEKLQERIKELEDNHKDDIINSVYESRNAYRSMSAREYYNYKYTPKT